MGFLYSTLVPWRDWFCSLRRWNSDVKLSKRLALLDIQGLPLHAWNHESVAKIGKLWGEAVKTELEGESRIRKIAATAGLLTEKEEWIRETIEVSIGEDIFKVRVMEKTWDNLELGEIIESVHNSESEFLSDEDGSGWAESEEVEECGAEGRSLGTNG